MPERQVSQRRANRSGALLAMTTFLGEHADIIGPDAPVPAPGQTTERQWHVRRKSVDDMWDEPTRSPAGTCPDPGVDGSASTFGL